ncbi:flagellar hook-associated protein FlgK [Ferrovibrio sp.]|uniref:flagellar hook-associated protein FlgK n=1 Tax=Ferrovibrio sp. TaxID=1917215 RepID=UPI001B44C710|nr:flagellar hook-associated protein FlgK [Ferrovibrio sp.]MBP7064776.1 flagellar hook-associated protein FlgK [Ferrovibrio sp.]
MSLTAALSSSVSALATLQSQTRLLSANVANAQNENYTRKVASLTTPAIDGLPGSPLISQIVRVAAPEVQQDLYTAQATYGKLNTQKLLSADLAEILDTTTTTGEQPALAKLVSEFELAWKNLEANPENAALSSEVIRRGQDLAVKINQLNAKQTQLRTRADDTVQNAINTINDASIQIQKLNVQISSTLGSGQPTGDLEDLRDLQVARISEMVGVRTLTNDRGEMTVYTEAGVQITGTIAQQFTYTPSTTGNAGTITYQGATTTLNGGFLNGSIRAALDYLDPTTAAVNSPDPNVGTLAKYVNQLDSFAYNLINIVNTAYNAAEAAVPAPTPAEGTDFFTFGGLTSEEAQGITVNTDLINGNASLKLLAAGDVQQAMRNTQITLNDINRQGAEGNGLLTGNLTIFGLVDTVLAYHARNADVNATNADSAEQVQHTLDQKYRNLTGVDIDTELANLQILQNNYAAMANVLNSITTMFDQLVNIGR